MSNEELIKHLKEQIIEAKNGMNEFGDIGIDLLKDNKKLKQEIMKLKKEKEILVDHWMERICWDCESVCEGDHYIDNDDGSDQFGSECQLFTIKEIKEQIIKWRNER